MKVDHDGTSFVVDAGPRDTNLMRTIPGARARGGQWCVPATVAGAWQLSHTFPGELIKTPRCRDHLFALSQWAKNRQGLKDSTLNLDSRLYPFQLAGASLIADDSTLLADEMGTGKTVQALVGVRDLPGPGLIVCTKSMMHKWAEEVRTWTNLSHAVVEGSADKRRKILAASDVDVFIINYELLRYHSYLQAFGKQANEGEPGHLNREWGWIIADEAHKIKDPRAKQSRALHAINTTAKRRVALTGTPVVNNPDDLWAIMHFVSPEEWPVRSKFRDRYCLVLQKHWGGVENIGLRKEAEPELRKFLDPRFLRRTKAEVLPDLPDKTFEVLTLPLTGKQRTAYRQMQKEMLADIEGKLLMAPNPLTMLQRLRQLACALPVVNDDNEVVALDTPSNKLDAIVDILEEHGPGVVIYAESRKFIELLHSKLHDTYLTGLITGKVSASERQQTVAQFQDGKLDLVLGTVGAGAEGITLTRADLMIFAQRSWSNAANKQAQDRIHRIGQENKVQYITLVSEGTVDIAVERACEMKEERLQEVVRDPEWLRAALEGR